MGSYVLISYTLLNAGLRRLKARSSPPKIAALSQNAVRKVAVDSVRAVAWIAVELPEEDLGRRKA